MNSQHGAFQLILAQFFVFNVNGRLQSHMGQQPYDIQLISNYNHFLSEYHQQILMKHKETIMNSDDVVTVGLVIYYSRPNHDLAHAPQGCYVSICVT